MSEPHTCSWHSHYNMSECSWLALLMVLACVMSALRLDARQSGPMPGMGIKPCSHNTSLPSTCCLTHIAASVSFCVLPTILFSTCCLVSLL